MGKPLAKLPTEISGLLAEELDSAHEHQVFTLLASFLKIQDHLQNDVFTASTQKLFSDLNGLVVTMCQKNPDLVSTQFIVKYYAKLLSFNSPQLTI